MIVAIDPGTTQSAYVLMDEEYKIYRAEILPNAEMLDYLKGLTPHLHKVVIEMIKSYGARVGQETFETCVWIGKFSLYEDTVYIDRRQVKKNLCPKMKSNDAIIRQTLTNRFGDGLRKKLKYDLWQAYAVGVTYVDVGKENGWLDS